MDDFTQMTENTREEIVEFGSLTTKNSRGNIHCLTIVGQVEGHQLLPSNIKSTKYEHVMPQLAAIEESEEIDALLILLNTVGGDIEAGLALAELIRGMKKPTASLVLGGGHSIGVPLATAAAHCLIAPTAAMTIHPVRLNGTVIGVPQTFAYFERIQERIIEFVTATSRVEESVLRKLMLATDGALAGDVGSVIYGDRAVELGIVDATGGLSDALEYLHGEIDRRRAARGVN
ncbi:Clp protease [Clostridia bacterium]|nr:Clp protease [Clostridia bacterium]